MSNREWSCETGGVLRLCGTSVTIQYNSETFYFRVYVSDKQHPHGGFYSLDGAKNLGENVAKDLQEMRSI